MSQSLSGVYLHLVFSTKHRQRLLQEVGVRAELHALLGGVSKRLDCPPVQVGGVEDHVHVLARFGRTLSLAGWVKELKRVSSTWVCERGGTYRDFAWQTGYAVFSVSTSRLDAVTRYIRKQPEHHRNVAFQDEVRTLLERHRVSWDERYIWD